MVDFPQTLHAFHHFEVEGRQYIADLDVGCVTEVDEATANAIDLCTSLDMAHLTKALETKNGLSTTMKTMRRLQVFARLNLFFAGQKRPLNRTLCEGDLHIFVSPFFLDEQGTASFISKIDTYQLLAALAKQAKVSLGFPVVQEGEQESVPFFEVEGIQKVRFEKNTAFSLVRFIPENCNGVLLLSSFSHEELVLFKGMFPVVSRIISDELRKDQMIQPTLDRYFLLRDYDALCPDASWTKNALAGLSLEMEYLQTIPPGVNHDVFRPRNRQQAKANIAQAFANADLLEKPIVVIFPGVYPETGIPFIETLSSLHRELMFLIVDAAMEQYIQTKPDNVEFYEVTDAQDSDALSAIFNAADIAFFPAMLGVSPSYVLSAMACGVPMLVASERMPEEVGDGGLLIQADRDSYGDVLIPVEPLSQKLRFLLTHEAERQMLSTNAQKHATAFRWEATAAKLGALFLSLNERKLSQPPIDSRFPVRFLYAYNREKGCVQPHAISLPSLRKPPMEEALARTLLIDHTPQAVEAVLTYFCEDRTKAKTILERFISP